MTNKSIQLYSMLYAFLVQLKSKGMKKHFQTKIKKCKTETDTEVAIAKM